MRIFSAGVAIFYPITWRKTLADENYTNFPDDGLTGHMQYSLLARTASFLYTPEVVSKSLIRL